MKPYKSALEIGDVVKLKHHQIVGMFERKTFDEGTELKVIEKDKHGLTAQDKKGRTITWLLDNRNPDLDVDYIGKEFTN